MSPADLRGRTALISGASRGIGLEVARGLLERGARVFAISRDSERARRAQAELAATFGDRIEFVPADLSRVSEIRRLAAAIREKTRVLHILVNNAGVFMRNRRITEDGLELTFAVNQMAPFLLTRELLDLLRASTPARVINVSSEAHRRARFDLTDLQCETGYRGMTAYANSKLANILFTRELTHRVGTGEVTAVALHPGVVDTSLLDNYFREMPWVLRIFLPLFRRAVTSEAHVAAESVLRLAADMGDAEIARHNGSYFTGGHVRKPDDEAISGATAAVWWESVGHIVDGYGKLSTS